MVLGDEEILATFCGLEGEDNKLQMNGFELMNMTDYGLEDEKYILRICFIIVDMR